MHSPPDRVPAVLADHARLAENSGFEAVWLAEHHFIRYGGCPSPPVLAAHLLAATTRLRIGTAACVLSHRHPVALAEEVAMLDALSPGRFLLGVARGGPWIDLTVFGSTAERHARGFPESLDLLRDWLCGPETVGADGEFFRFPPVTVRARPSSPVPIWVAATSPSTVDEAARRGLPLLLGVHTDDTERAAALRRYRDTARRFGHDPARAQHAAVSLACVAGIGSRGALLRWLSIGVGDYRRIDGSCPDTDRTGYVDHLLAIHPPDSANRILDRVTESARRLGITRSLLMVEGAGEPDAVAATVRALGEVNHADPE